MSDASRRLSKNFESLLANISQQKTTLPEDEEMVRANQTGASAYFLYEKFRTAFEYQEQHLFLRSAIARYLNRRLRFSKKRKGLGIELITELIKTRYLKNDSVPLKSANLIDELIKDYLELYNHAIVDTASPTVSDDISDFVIEILSFEIARVLLPRPRDEWFVNFTYSEMRARIPVEKLPQFDPAAFHASLFANIHKRLLKTNIPIIRYYSFYQQFPHWRKDIKATASKFYEFNVGLEKQLSGPLHAQVSKIVRRKIAPFRVLFELILEADSAEHLVRNREEFHHRLRSICERDYALAKQRLSGAIIRSIVFLFLTKVILAFIIEIPYDKVVEGGINWVPLAVNISLPIVYMLLIGLTIRVPGAENTKRLISDVEKLVSGSSSGTPYRIKTPRASTASTIFNGLYMVSFVVTVYFISLALSELHFNLVSAIIFFLFFTTVSFFGLRISQSAKELLVVEEKKGLLGAIIDFVYTPFIRIGQWLSDKYSRFNLFNNLLDIFLEMPFKSILRIFEQWVGFIRQKRDDLL